MTTDGPVDPGEQEGALVPADGRRLADLDEDALLRLFLPLMPRSGKDVLVPAGDDTAWLRARTGAVLATTDAMVRGADWRDDWSTPQDVGAKVVAQNLADLAAMGGRGTGLLVTLAAEPDLAVDWVLGLAQGLGAAAREAGVPVLGGDLSSAPAGTVMVSVTALGEVDGAPVRRDGARVGDVVAVAGTLGRAGAGLVLLSQGRPQDDPGLVAVQRRPQPPYAQGPAARAAGARALIDLSDGLVRDAGRVARASGVGIELTGALLAGDVERLTAALPQEQAWECVLAGGEEHSLLGCFPPAVALPGGWRPVGRAVAGSGVTLDGRRPRLTGWDHFAGT